MKIFFTLFLFASLFMYTDCVAQTDSLIGIAKELIKHNKYNEAEQIYIRLLNENDNNNDVRFALGLLYSWDKQYDKAENIFTPLIKAFPTNKEMIIASLNNRLWANKNEQVITLSDSANQFFPDDADIQIRKAKALMNLDRLNEAQSVVEGILAKDKNNQEAKDLLTIIKAKKQKNSIGINYTFDFFTNNNETRHWAYIQYKRKTKLGSIIGRINYSHRFKIDGYQAEIDAYPILNKNSYAYLNFGISPSPLFPDYRFGIEYYRKFPKAFEASIGLRHLIFNTVGVTIFTGHLGKYIGNYWLSIRPFVIPVNSNISASLFFLARRYFSNPEDYIGLQIGYGTSPDDRSTQSDLRLKSYQLKLNYNHLIRPNWTINIGGGYANEKFITTIFRTKLTAEITINYLF